MTVEQVFNDLVAWIKQSPSDGSPIHVVTFQHVTIGGAGTVGYAYGSFTSGSSIGTSGAALTGGYEQAVSNLGYNAATGT